MDQPDALERNAPAVLEVHRHTAHDAFGRPNNEQFIVDGLIHGGFTEEIADRDQHLPFGAGEIQEGKRLPDLHVESRTKPWTIRALTTAEGTREAVADAVQDQHPRRGFRHVRLDGRRYIVDTLRLTVKR